jgi:hypothetical protein
MRRILLTVTLLLTGMLLLIAASYTFVDELDPVYAEAPGADAPLEVPLDVVEGGNGGTLAFVPVTIHGQGPFTFALDTGASHSVLDAAIAEQIGLEQADAPAEVTGVVGGAEAVPVHVDDWQVDGVDLGARPVLTLALAPGNGIGLQGLLGSDVLSEFGAVTVDYDAATLTLRPRDTSP